MIELLQDLERQIESLKRKGLYRTLVHADGVDFSSNDYLGLSSSPDFSRRIVARFGDQPITAPASRLLRGNTDVHERLERRLAEFKGTESALLFSSGYQANMALLATVITRRDRVLSDALNHASLIDGIRQTRAQKVIFPHINASAMEETLRVPFPGGRTYIVTESLFSMDGDIAPLDRYAELAEQYGALLIVDDAHATGVFGSPRGSGLVEEFGISRRVLAIMSTFGKALGTSGACVAGPRSLIDFLINRSRPFVFTTAVPPLLLYAIETALEMIEERGELRHRVLAQADRLRHHLRQAGLTVPDGPGPIVPVRIGEPNRAVSVAKAVQNSGYDVRAIRPPTVPIGTSRIRVSVHANHTDEDIDGLAAAISRALATDRQPA